MFRELTAARRSAGQPCQTQRHFCAAVTTICALILLMTPSIGVAADDQMLKRLRIMKKCELCNLAGADLRHISLARANLAGANLRGANLEGTNLTRANLRGAKLAGANLSGATLTNTDLRGARLTGANLAGADLTSARLERAWLQKVDLRGATLQKVRFAGATLQGADLRDTDLTKVNLSTAVLRRVNLSGSDLQGQNFKGIDLTGANLARANLRRTNFASASLAHADLRAATLTNTNLRQATLSGADLSDAQLSKADLSEAELVGTKLINANLEGTSLQNARMTGAKSKGARFAGSNMRGAALPSADLSQADLSKAALNDANLGAANLHEASLEGANLAGADLRFADLRDTDMKDTLFPGADLRGAKVAENDLKAADVTEAKLDRALMAALVRPATKPRSRESVKSSTPRPATAKRRDLIPQKIKKSGLSVALVDVAQLPPSSEEKPLARVNWLHHAGDGSGRLFAADMRGKIHVIKNGRILPTPFLDIAKIRGAGFYDRHFEAGLSTFAFHPNYGRPGQPGYGKFYTVHTERGRPSPGQFGRSPPPRIFASPIEQNLHDDILIEWTVDRKNPDLIDPATAREVLRIQQPHRDHNTGLLAFNPTARIGSSDLGMLYIGVGDGGDTTYSGVVDAQKVAQNYATPFGSILRINPLAKGRQPYTVPGDNPFVDKAGYLPEIWAYGFRNPIRFAWDTGGSHQMIISDIGQAGIEEINLGAPGANYGWSEREGTFTVDRADQLNLGRLPADDMKNRFAYPVAQYDHSEGRAVIGGFVYRGRRNPDLRGLYIFGDIVTGRIFYVAVRDLVFGHRAEISELTLLYNGRPSTLREILGDDRADLRFGMSENGEIYILTKRDGMIRKFQPAAGLRSDR